MSDVLNDARTMLEDYVSDLTEHHDPITLLEVFGLLIERWDMTIDEFLANDLSDELIQASQSNPNGVKEDLRKALNALE